MLSLLKSSDITLLEIETNLVDAVWGSERPPRPTNPVRMLGIEFSGKSVKDKLAIMREDMTLENAETLVVSELDEIACKYEYCYSVKLKHVCAWVKNVNSKTGLLNLRGTDLPEAPTFFAFAILTHTEIELFIEDVKLSDEIKGTLINETDATISFSPYQTILDRLKIRVGRNLTNYM